MEFHDSMQWPSDEDVSLDAYEHKSSPEKGTSFHQQLDQRMKFREKYVRTGEKRERETIELQEKIARLKFENDELRSHLQRARSTSSSIHIGLQAKLEVLEDNSLVNQEKIEKAIKVYTDLYSECRSLRKNEAEYHLNQLRKQLVPINTTKMILWLCVQKNSFFKSSKSPIFKALQSELGLSQDQVDSIRRTSDKAWTILGQYHILSEFMSQLRVAAGKQQESFATLERIAQDAGVTSTQKLEFILWLKNNVSNVGRLSSMPSIVKGVHESNLAFADAELMSHLTEILNSVDCNSNAFIYP